jgi:hypothetical protein
MLQQRSQEKLKVQDSHLDAMAAFVASCTIDSDQRASFARRRDGQTSPMLLPSDLTCDPVRSRLAVALAHGKGPSRMRAPVRMTDDWLSRRTLLKSVACPSEEAESEAGVAVKLSDSQGRERSNIGGNWDGTLRAKDPEIQAAIEGLFKAYPTVKIGLAALADDTGDPAISR